jgi:hypothetical protein
LGAIRVIAEPGERLKRPYLSRELNGCHRRNLLPKFFNPEGIPLVAKSGDTIDSPVDKNAKFTINVPIWYRIGLE